MCYNIDITYVGKPCILRRTAISVKLLIKEEGNLLWKILVRVSLPLP